MAALSVLAYIAAMGCLTFTALMLGDWVASATRPWRVTRRLRQQIRNVVQRLAAGHEEMDEVLAYAHRRMAEVVRLRQSGHRPDWEEWQL